MARIAYPGNSAYATTPQTSWYIDRYVHRSIAADSGDRPFVLDSQYEGRADKLANDLYGSPAYWWVFAVRNPALRADPFFGLHAGMTLIVPSSEHLRRTIG